MIVDNWKIPNTIYTQYLDLVTGEQLVEYALIACGDNRFDNLKFIIADWTLVKKTQISAQDVKELVACLISISRICPKAANATIVRRNEDGMALAAWYRHLADMLPWKIDIFHSVEEAFDYYNLDLKALENGDHHPPT